MTAVTVVAFCGEVTVKLSTKMATMVEDQNLVDMNEDKDSA